jgi:hemolysin-activating ACP:hemolysin acyltransferase
MIFGSKSKAGAGRAPETAPQGGTKTGADAGKAGGPSAAAASPADKPNSEDAQRRAAIAIRQSLAFAQIVSVLMRSPHYKHYTLSDLEWLVLPPLLTGQFSVAEASAKEGGPRFPVAVALWASVSAEVDKRLSENLSTPIRLRPDEWKSGDTLWLVDAIGDGRIVGPLLKQLGEGLWKGRDVKMRIPGEAGRPEVKRLSEIQTVQVDKPK